MITKGITDKNYEPLVIRHSCPVDRVGKEMTLEEKDRFAIDFLYDAYKGRGSNIDYNSNRNIDLTLSGGIHKNLIVRFADSDGNCSPYNPDDILKAYEDDGAYPVLVLISFLDMTIFQETGEPGALICGDEFCAKMSCKSLLPIVLEPNRLFSDDDIVKELVQAWQNLDPSIFEETLHSDFNYSSAYVLDILSCRKEYIDYISGKFATLRRNGTAPKVSTGIMNGKPVVVLTQDGNPPAALTFETSNTGRITEMEMVNFKDDNVKTLSKYELEFRWIPSLVISYNSGRIPMQGLTDIRWWKESLAKMGFGNFGFSFNEIKLQSMTFADGTPVLIYEFPSADMAPLAKYGMVIFGKDKKGLYVTLETDIAPSTYYLGGQDGEKHQNYGQVKACSTTEEFKAVVEQRFGHSKKKGLLGIFKK